MVARIVLASARASRNQQRGGYLILNSTHSHRLHLALKLWCPPYCLKLALYPQIFCGRWLLIPGLTVITYTCNSRK